MPACVSSDGKTKLAKANGGKSNRLVRSSGKRTARSSKVVVVCVEVCGSVECKLQAGAVRVRVWCVR